MTSRRKAAFGGALVGLGLLAVTAIPSFAQENPAPAGGVPTHEQMHEMMDGMHGAGTTERMHEMMGNGDAQRGEQLMEQCASMMGMMQNMGGMMGGAGGMSGMMGGQNGQSMPDMMRGMMGR